MAGTARADENLLRGPHPFRRENQLSAHVLVASGRGDSMSGTKLAFDYNFKLTGGWIPLWLDFGLNVQHAACNQSPTAAACTHQHRRRVRDVRRASSGRSRRRCRSFPYVGRGGRARVRVPQRRVGGDRPR